MFLGRSMYRLMHPEGVHEALRTSESCDWARQGHPGSGLNVGLIIITTRQRRAEGYRRRVVEN